MKTEEFSFLIINEIVTKTRPRVVNGQYSQIYNLNKTSVILFHTN